MPEEAKPLSSPETFPQVITLDITPEFYEQMKVKVLREINPIVRTYINEYFDYLHGLDPDDVIDAIARGETIKARYESMTYFAERVSLAAVRGFLKVAPERMNKQARDVINFENTMWTIRFENPTVYKIIGSFGTKGTDWLRQCINEVRGILGIEEEKP